MGVVLVVDDESMIRDLANRILTKHGHEIIAAETAQEALTAFTEHAGAINVILLDYSLPGTSGIDLLRQFRAIRPDIPCILSSGHPLRLSDLAPDIQPHTQLLQKPYRAADLREAVTSAITSVSKG